MVFRGRSRKSPTDLCWAGREDFPLDLAAYGFEIVGSMGSGKTTLMLHLLHSIIRLIGPAYDIRVLLNDPKQQIYSILEVLGVPFDLFNPFDRRSKRWNIGKDIGLPIYLGGDTSYAIEYAVSSLPLPVGGAGPHEIFYKYQQQIFAAVLEALSYRSGINWTLRDVFHAFESFATLEEVLNFGPAKCHLSILRAREFLSVFMQMKSNLQRWQSAIATMELAEEEFSVRDWTQQQRILLLGEDPERASATEAINAGLVSVASKCLLSQTHLNSPDRYSFVFLDELASSLLPYSVISTLQTKGREFGISTVVAFQDFDDLASKAGENVAYAIISQPKWKIFLKQESRRTADICAELLRGGRNVPGIQGPQIMALPLFGPGTPLKGYASDLCGPCEFTITQRYLEKRLFPLLRQAKLAGMGLQPIPYSQMRLQPWNEDDLRRLQLIEDLPDHA